MGDATPTVQTRSPAVMPPPSHVATSGMVVEVQFVQERFTERLSTMELALVLTPPSKPAQTRGVPGAPAPLRGLRWEGWSTSPAPAPTAAIITIVAITVAENIAITERKYRPHDGFQM